MSIVTINKEALKAAVSKYSRPAILIVAGTAVTLGVAYAVKRFVPELVEESESE